MRSRWASTLTTALSAALATVLVLTSAAAASATDPVTLGSGYVLDDVGVLSAGQEAEAQSRLEKLKTDSGLDLWVVYVDEFTDPAASEEWANTTAEINGLGPTQYLLAVATQSRQFYLSGDSAGPVSGDQLSEIEQGSSSRGSRRRTGSARWMPPPTVCRMRPAADRSHRRRLRARDSRWDSWCSSPSPRSRS